MCMEGGGDQGRLLGGKPWSQQHTVGDEGGSWYSGDLRLKSVQKQGRKAPAWLGCLEKRLEGKPMWVPWRMQWG